MRLKLLAESTAGIVNGKACKVDTVMDSLRLFLLLKF
jgi:hypothetical protein